MGKCCLFWKTSSTAHISLRKMLQDRTIWRCWEDLGTLHKPGGCFQRLSLSWLILEMVKCSKICCWLQPFKCFWTASQYFWHLYVVKPTSFPLWNRILLLQAVPVQGSWRHSCSWEIEPLLRPDAGGPSESFSTKSTVVESILQQKLQLQSRSLAWQLTKQNLDQLQWETNTSWFAHRRPQVISSQCSAPHRSLLLRKQAMVMRLHWSVTWHYFYGGLNNSEIGHGDTLNVQRGDCCVWCTSWISVDVCSYACVCKRNICVYVY